MSITICDTHLVRTVRYLSLTFEPVYKTSFNTTWQSNHPLPFGNELFCCEHPLLKLP